MQRLQCATLIAALCADLADFDQLLLLKSPAVT